MVNVARAIHHSAVAPSPISQGLDSTIRRLHSKVETSGLKCSISSLSAPTDVERRQLWLRKEELEGTLGGTGEAAITQHVAVLLSGFPSRNMPESERRGVLKLYVTALGGYPEWAIREACRRFNDGRAGSREYAPTPAMLAGECMDIVREVQTERHKIEQILKAEVYHEGTAEEKARINARFDELLGFLKPEKVKRKPTGLEHVDLAEKHEEHLAKLRAETETLTLEPSESLLKSNAEYSQRLRGEA